MPMEKKMKRMSGSTSPPSERFGSLHNWRRTIDRRLIYYVEMDRGYGWLVVFASLMTNAICDGVAYSFGILFPLIQKRYKCGKGLSAVVGGLFMAMPLLAGPIASTLIDKWDFRKATMWGGAVAFFGVFLSAYATSISVLMVTFGLIAGLGLSVCYSSGVVAVSFYFSKRRGIATGIALTGSGIGSVIFPPLTEKFLEIYDWHGTLLLLSGLVLHLTFFAALYRDPRYSPLTDVLKGVYWLKLQMKRRRRHNRRSRAKGRSLKRVNNGKPKAAPTNHKATKAATTTSPVDKKPPTVVISQKQSKRKNLDKKGASVKKGSLNNVALKTSCKKESTEQISLNTAVNQESSPCDPKSSDDLDLLKTASSSSKGMWEYVYVFKNFRFTIFMISNFLLYAFNDIFYVNLPEYVSMTLQVSSNKVSWIVPIVGAANTLTIPLFGYLADKPWINNRICLGVCNFICGICLVVVFYAKSYYGFCVVSAIFGLAISASATLTPIIVIELLSLDEFVTAFGTLHFIQGIGNLFGTPFVGTLYDWTGSYKSPFFTGAAGLVLSAFLLFFMEIPRVKQRSVRK